MRGRTVGRLASIGLAVAAVVWTAVVIRQANMHDDGGPPLGAIAMAVPALLLLIAAGAAWPRTGKGQ